MTLDDGENRAAAGVWGDGDFLLNGRTSRHLGWKGNFNGGAVDLEGHVRVIPLILHFKNIAFKSDFALHTGKDLVGDAADICKGLEGVDGLWEMGGGPLSIL